jgi:hypothetical protein
MGIIAYLAFMMRFIIPFKKIQSVRSYTNKRDYGLINKFSISGQFKTKQGHSDRMKTEWIQTKTLLQKVGINAVKKRLLVLRNDQQRTISG